MPPKAKDKKAKQETLPAGVDFTRRPLPVLEPCDARPVPRRELRVVSAHHAFEEWDEDALAEIDWGTAGVETPFEDKDGRSFLPASMAARVVRWVRPKDLLTKNKDESDERGETERTQSGVGAADVADKKDKASGGRGKGKAKPPKGKDKGPSSEPVVLEDAAADEEGNPLPRVVIFAPTAARDGADGFDIDDTPGETPESVPVRHASDAAIPRGFKPGWSKEQRQQISSLLCRGGQQHQQQQERSPADSVCNSNATAIGQESPPKAPVAGIAGDTTNAASREDGDRTSVGGGGPHGTPDFLSDEDIATFGAPCGGDIDPTMTAVFKAVGQLAPTLSSTECPLLWEAIYPKTSDQVPCYNPCGRYAVKLFAAGRWRKVEVDDCIPLDVTRCPVVAASENPLELWPILLSKALYKVYRLGGYEPVRDASTEAATADSLQHALMRDGVVDGRDPAGGVSNGDGDGDDGDEDGGGLDGGAQARFVAFALHSLAGWIPSITGGVSTETALMQGTPGLTPDDLHLPSLPPVDEEEEAFRERLEERKRRQALFLHKKRRPRKVERKIVSAEERAEVELARLRKMRAVTEKLLRRDRREVFVVCMPRKPACPVLAVCPNVFHLAAWRNGTSTLPLAQQQKEEQQQKQPQGVVATVTTGVGTSSSSFQHQQPPFASTTPEAPTAPAEAATANIHAANDDESGSPGFLLQWETLQHAHQSSAARSSTGANVTGQRPDGFGDGPQTDLQGAGRDNMERELNGGGGGRLGRGMEPAAEATGSPSSLPTPVYLWLSPREIELAGGAVVRALTNVDKRARADVQYHWKLAPSVERVEAPDAGIETTGGKDAASKAKGKAGGASDKAKDNAAAVKKQGTGTKGSVSRDGRSSFASASEESITPSEAECSPPHIVMVGGVPVPKGLEGVKCRDPGTPPAIFLLVTPSPRSEPKENALPESKNMRTWRSRNGSHKESTVETPEVEKPSIRIESPPKVAVGNGNPNDGEGAEESAEGTEASARFGKVEAEEEDEEEDAEILMHLWADRPGVGRGISSASSMPKRTGAHATVVLQEVLPGGLYACGDFSKPVPGGRLVMRATFDVEGHPLPFTAASAKVRLTKGGAPRVFRVLLQPGLGCCVGFYCTHTLETGDAGQIWAEAGHSQVTEAGKYESARPGEWKILLRRAFRVTAAGQHPSDQSESSLVPTDKSDGTADGSLSADTSPPETTVEEGAREKGQKATRARGSTAGGSGRASIVPTGSDGADGTVRPSPEGRKFPAALSSADFCFVRAILHLPDEESRPSVSLAFIDDDTGLEMIQPTLHTNALPLKPNRNGYSVLAVACSRTKAIPKGAWRLQLLSDRPLLPLHASADGGGRVPHLSPGSPRGIPNGVGGAGEGGQGEGSTTVVPCQERVVYGGTYVPNKSFLLFRDVLKCASPLPFAVRVRFARPGVCLRLKFLDATTGETLRDLRGNHVVQALTVTPPAATIGDALAPPAKDTPATKEGSKDKEKAAAAATEKSTTPAPGKMIVEATLDRERMEVPPDLVSKLPHYFQPTPEGMRHYCPPISTTALGVALRPSNSAQLSANGDCAEEGSTGGGRCERSSSSLRSLMTPSSSSSSTAAAAAAAAAPIAGQRSADLHSRAGAAGPEHSDAISTPAESSENTGEPLSWWLEIVGGGEVTMAHDASRVYRENRQIESWEAAEPGRAARAALLWTQREASKVAKLGNGSVRPASRSSLSGTNESVTTSPTVAADGNPRPGSEGYEDWIKARAAAVGVPVDLEKERHACRLALLTRPATDNPLPVAPSSGCSSAAEPPAPSPAPQEVVVLGEEDMKQRAKEREATRLATIEFEKEWEADRVRTVEAGMEQMAMQLKYIRGREEKIKAGRLPFLLARDKIVLDLIAKAEARKEAFDDEKAALETSQKGSKAKQAKGKPGKK